MATVARRGGPGIKFRPRPDAGGVKRKSWLQRPLLYVGILLLVVVVVLVAVTVIQTAPVPQKLKYGVVLDAGSSHTALFIYHWPAEKMNDTGLVEQLGSCSVKGPGISSYWSEVERAGPSLQACLDKAMETIPAQQHTETPVYLGATAGLRLLRLQNRIQAEKLLHAVEQFIHTYPFDFQGARIISGLDEGAFGWITINYLMGILQQDTAGEPDTLGALDLGGGSTQITFVPDREVQAPQNAMHFRLYGRDYNMYTHSFLCYGKDQALKMLLQNLMVPDQGTIRNPCFNLGYEKSINVSDFFNSPCTPGMARSRNQTLRVVGTGDSRQCRLHVRALFNHSTCSWTNCSFNGIYQPPVWGNFGAFSAYYFVTAFFNKGQQRQSLSELKEAVEKFCNLSWAQAKAIYKIKERYLSENCFSGHYVLALLISGYNFSAATWDSIQFIKKIKGSDAGWTLGYMLNLTNMIPAEGRPPKPLSPTSFLSILVVFSIAALLLLLAVFLLAYRRISRERQMLLT
ncbi:ectonucleoside triphosphate diphosphohydrolase 1 isoform X1 [Leucoraja erinacea]|uniref:ectonucleoside triphosphate diphosphohydrolase 1 isoform X1 n=1 Tax=Leucoraja erinaceus TaxID=7782 RepID=UPI002457FF72|nr:ectonucleoside triphosphate diphosphohydrolase 1 isoform X1 [Leucoraja erinacea]